MIFIWNLCIVYVDNMCFVIYTVFVEKKAIVHPLIFHLALPLFYSAKDFKQKKGGT